MGQLTRETEERMLRWLLIDSQDSTLVYTQPLEVRLMSLNGSDTVEGVEIEANSYEPGDIEWAISSEPTAVEYVNLADVDFPILDTDEDITISGVEIWDSSTEPRRVAFASLPGDVIIPAGNSFTIIAGKLKVRLS